ncbi:helix-turn-helix domain-containing protein [Actomonas aquatica]|uniref:Helix-turn-helix domain-containing protein n=1 Tax=Actomonas aquatica TaxID=2866162 RepID=A0ABZ1CAJ7_9BACT|nr:helix-turn-helix domain-containing protein [Opitutus sp. WL0086]WRQ88624.1 helix-turn-helix domain-containing protein [Opitutus sp. WL0086]
MVTDKIKELQELQAKAAQLQEAIEVERTRELAALPAKYGYTDLNAFIKALKSAAGTTGKKRGRKAKGAPKAAKPAKRSRAKITDELKAQVKEAVEAGETGAAIAERFGISVPSVQNIKKEFGLVKPRGSDSAPASTES